ncbi:hypothetical protein B0J13DRAFT_222196 [Dactylonectria estremocensis]|uniref:Uncharacterized protein n=1 Tax=Dactylonectria estremocensis TaxID=1079267 RepID=A0A9P9F7D7_9HYPO|nr:hypothetical protein B0J13DRAFT_222196 [Dactylonectria estremocensis]
MLEGILGWSKWQKYSIKWYIWLPRLFFQSFFPFFSCPISLQKFSVLLFHFFFLFFFFFLTLSVGSFLITGNRTGKAARQPTENNDIPRPPRCLQSFACSWGMLRTN